jgi:2',3'-cyclic-nucleotide 2'-phosphodiesterase (5'-nucleotidase family)
MKPLRRRLAGLSYANVMSTIAVVLAIGTGSAFAAATIGSPEVIDESLTGTDVKNGSLTASDLAKNSIPGANITDDTVRGSDVKEETLGNVPSASYAASATSAAHATTADDAAIKGYQVIYRTAPYDGQVKKDQTVDVPCPAGKRPIGGGGMTYSGAMNPDGNEVAIVESRPYGGYTYGPDDNRPEAWRVKAEATDRATYSSFTYITAYAVCAKTDMP